MDVKKWIKVCEALKLKPYKDIVGKITIGYGRNLSDDGISAEEASILFDNDFDRTQRELSQYAWFNNQSENVQDALLNMNFNLGITRLLEFKEMIAALNEKDFNKAAIAALDSEWAHEVGQRAKDIAVMIRQG